MTFANPLFLLGALGAAIPLIIHLWGRRRPRRVLFPSVRFIRAGARRRPALSRLRELLLLFLRMLLIILVSVALAGPTVEGRLWAALAERDHQAAIILDASASMAHHHEGRTSFDRAREAAGVIHERLPPGFTREFFAAGAELTPLGPDPDAWEDAAPGHERARLLDLVNRADAPSLWAPQARLFLITDLQETSLRGELAAPLPQPPVVVDVGAPQPHNHAVTDVFASTPCPLRGRPLELEVTVHVTGEDDGDDPLDVTATVNDRTIPGRSIPASPGTRHTRLRFIPDAGGDLVIRTALPPDDLPADDVHFRVERVHDRLRATVITGRSDPEPVSLALNPGGEVDTRIDVTALDWGAAPTRPPDADLLVVADSPPGAALVAGLPAFVRGGGGLLLFTGPEAQVEAAVLEALLGAPVRLGGVVAAPGDEPLVLAQFDTFRPPLEAFAHPRAGNLLDLRFTHRRALEGAEAARVLARFSDGAPAVVGTLDPDRRVILVNTTPDDRWTNAPYEPVFVPLMHRLCYEVVGPPPRVWQDGFVGEPLYADLPEGARGAARVRAPDGEIATVPPADGRWAFTPPLPGVYEATWDENGGEARALFAANVPPAESDLARIAPAELKRRLGDPRAEVVPTAELAAWFEDAAPTRAHLTAPLLLLALLVLVAETLLSAPRRRAQSEETAL